MLDFNNIELDLPDSAQLNLEELMGSIHLSVSAEDLNQMAAGLLEGYQNYAAENPQADYSRLGEYFLSTLGLKKDFLFWRKM